MQLAQLSLGRAHCALGHFDIRCALLNGIISRLQLGPLQLRALFFEVELGQLHLVACPHQLLFECVHTRLEQLRELRVLVAEPLAALENALKRRSSLVTALGKGRPSLQQ